MDSTKRFSDRVEDYKKYRPNYPSEIIPLLKRHCGLNAQSRVADIGSGTGIFTTLLLPHVKVVYAVEPNEDMRRAAEQSFSEAPNVVSVNGSAEDTTLPAQSLDLVVSAQAFHWFDHPHAKCEFSRIMRKHGSVILVWNDRDTRGSAFQRAYDHMLTTHMSGMKPHTTSIHIIDQFYHPHTWELFTFPHQQIFDFEGLKGRLLSTSHIPKEGHPAYPHLMMALQQLYDEYQVNSRITFAYETKVYIGKIG